MKRGHLNNKAFTLIDLLAIIVILAIIAVITVPIILNVIDNSKKGSATDSAYGFKDAVQKCYMNGLPENATGRLLSYEEANDTSIFENRTLRANGNNYRLGSVSGDYVYDVDEAGLIERHGK